MDSDKTPPVFSLLKVKYKANVPKEEQDKQITEAIEEWIKQSGQNFKVVKITAGEIVPPKEEKELSPQELIIECEKELRQNKLDNSDPIIRRAKANEIINKYKKLCDEGIMKCKCTKHGEEQ